MRKMRPREVKALSRGPQAVDGKARMITRAARVPTCLHLVPQGGSPAGRAPKVGPAEQEACWKGWKVWGPDTADRGGAGPPLGLCPLLPEEVSSIGQLVAPGWGRPEDVRTTDWGGPVCPHTWACPPADLCHQEMGCVSPFAWLFSWRISLHPSLSLSLSLPVLSLCLPVSVSPCLSLSVLSDFILTSYFFFISLWLVPGPNYFHLLLLYHIFS